MMYYVLMILITLIATIKLLWKHLAFYSFFDFPLVISVQIFHHSTNSKISYNSQKDRKSNIFKNERMDQSICSTISCSNWTPW